VLITLAKQQGLLDFRLKFMEIKNHFKHGYQG